MFYSDLLPWLAQTPAASLGVNEFRKSLWVVFLGHSTVTKAIKWYRKAGLEPGTRNTTAEEYDNDNEENENSDITDYKEENCDEVKD